MAAQTSGVVEPTPVSRLIAPLAPLSCGHDWRLYDGFWGPYGHRAAGSGRGFCWWVAAGDPRDDDFNNALAAACAANPQLPRSLVETMKVEDCDAFRQLIDRVWLEDSPK